MNPALRLAISVLALVLAADAMFKLGIFPGGTITQGVEAEAFVHPWLPWAYVGLCVFGHWHFFGPR